MHTYMVSINRPSRSYKEKCDAASEESLHTTEVNEHSEHNGHWISKWDKTFLILLGSDKTLVKMAKYLIDRYRLPCENIAVDGDVEGFPRLQPQFLQNSSENSKVIIVGHGSLHYIGSEYLDKTDNEKKILKRDPKDFSLFLKSIGLHKCGAISFKSCYMGGGSFLSDLAKNMESDGMVVGWLAGYKDFIVQTSNGAAVGNYESLLLRELSLKRDDKNRISVVRGNAPASPLSGKGKKYKGFVWHV